MAPAGKRRRTGAQSPAAPAGVETMHEAHGGATSLRKRPTNLFEQMAMLNDTAPTELDPEALDGDSFVLEPSYDEGFDAGDIQEPLNDGRRSNNRGQLIADDPTYAGTKSSRQDFEMSGSDSDADSNAVAVDALNRVVDLSDEESSGEASDIDDGVNDEQDRETDSEDDVDGLTSLGANPIVDEDIAAQLAQLEQSEQSVVSTLIDNPEVEMKRGKHTRCQLELWDSLVESRIRLQPVLQLANSLPYGDSRDELLPTVSEKIASARSHCIDSVWHLMKLKRSLLRKNPDIASCVPKLSKERRSGLKDASGWWSELHKTHKRFKPYLDDTMDKWHSKTSLAARKSKAYKALDRSLTKQVEQATADLGRLRQRTQTMRSKLSIITTVPGDEDTGDPQLDGSGKDGFGRNTNIFDDSDWYQNLLRELIERKSSKEAPADDPLAMGRQWVELNKHRVKIKKKVDTKASKGRKLRYDVVEKLVNFMAPDESIHPSSDQARDDLFAALFQSE